MRKDTCTPRYSVGSVQGCAPAPESVPGRWLPGLASGSISCGGCGGPVDPQGMHYGFCKNRHGVWTRHDTLEATLHHVLCYLRQRVRCTRGAGNLLNDVRPPRSRGNKPGWRCADLVIDGYSGIGRHLFLDVAIPDPCFPTAAPPAARPPPASPLCRDLVSVEAGSVQSASGRLCAAWLLSGRSVFPRFCPIEAASKSSASTPIISDT
jgi:hypothetical protein